MPPTESLIIYGVPSVCMYVFCGTSLDHHCTAVYKPLEQAGERSSLEPKTHMDPSHVWTFPPRSNLHAGTSQAFATYTRAPRISSIVVQMAFPDGSVSTSRFEVLRDHSIVEHDLSSTLRNSLNSVANRREENSSTCTPTPQRPPISPKVKLKT